MIGSLNPYSAYRDSGVAWLGEVPAHWEVRKLRSLYGQHGSGTTPVGDHYFGGDIPWIMSGDLNDGALSVTKRTVTRSALREVRALKMYPAHSLVIAMYGATIGKTGLSSVEACTNQACCVLADPLRDANSVYFQSVVNTARPYLIHRSFGGAQPNINAEIVHTLRVPVPPPPEQTAIVRFLDHANRRIRRYIRAKQKLIALLDEQKQAIIHQAVTGQVDVRTGQPYPAYKPSGVEWLGDVPTHWEVSRFGRFINLTVGFPFRSEGFTQSEHDIRLLRGVNVAPGRLRWGDLVRWPAADLDAFAEYWLAVGDIVLGMDRPIIGNGIRVAVVNQSDVPSLLLQRVARIRSDCRKLTQDFAFRLLSGTGFSDYLTPIFTGVSVPHLSPDQIKDFRVAIPTLTEQEAINEHLRLVFGNVQPAIEHAHSHVALLNEYRTRLITDVVTGKLDVREAAAALPEVDPSVIEGDLNDAFGADVAPMLDELDTTLEEAEA